MEVRQNAENAVLDGFRVAIEWLGVLPGATNWWASCSFCYCSGLTLSGHIGLMSVNFILMAVGYDILPVEFQRFPLQLTGETVAQRGLAWQWRDLNDSDHITRTTVDTIGPTWLRGYTVDHLILYYTRNDRNNEKNVFDRDVFVEMRQVDGSCS